LNPNAGRKQKSQRKRVHRKIDSPAELPLEEQEQYIAMDCEMVGVGLYGCQSALARVTLLDWNGKVVLDTLVRPQEEVTDYRTFVSGISADDFLNQDQNVVMDFEPCRQLVLSLIESKVIIGHGLKNDLHALQIYNHPWYLQRDTTKYEPFQRDESQEESVIVTQGSYYDARRPKARKLKDLVYEKLRRTIQPIGSVHDPKEDALGALDLYKLVRVKWEKCMAYKIAKTNQIIMSQQPVLGKSQLSDDSESATQSSQTDSEEETAVVSEDDDDSS
jgi:RNA exonuclease 4